MESGSKTGFLGFIIAIEGLKGLYNELCTKSNSLKYIPTYKISQDHIELFFGCIRSRGAWNNNSSARQFKAAIKQLLVHSDIRDSDSGNCIPIEDISILHVTSSQSSEQIINSSRSPELSDNEEIEWDKTEDLLHDHGYSPDIRILTEVSLCVMKYIAGFVVRRLQKSLDCQECINALTIDDGTSTNSVLTQVKSRGKLINPSSSVTTICEEAEGVIRFALTESGGKFMRRKYTDADLASRVLLKFPEPNNLFLNLILHSREHIEHLTKAIACKYIKSRLGHITKAAMEDVQSRRHYRNKLTFIQGQ